MTTPGYIETKIRLVIVEDEAIIAADLGERLEQLNYEICGIAASGIAGIAEAELQKPDLILMDIRLSGAMDGVEAAAIIRKNLDIPVIFLTGNSDNSTMQRAKLTEPYGFIVKPFRDTELQAAVEIGIYRHAMEVKLRNSELRYRQLVENSSDLIYKTDICGKFTYFNPAAIKMLGYSEAELSKMCFSDLLHPEHLEQVREFYKDQYFKKITESYFEFPVYAKDGSLIWLGQHTQLEYNKCQEIVAFFSIARNMTDLKTVEDSLIRAAEVLLKNNENLYRLAATDELTGLSNRRGFAALAEKQIELAKRFKKECLVVFIDLDGLKKINDVYGHDEGNCAIIQTADILRESFRTSDIIARFGGDEFVVLTTISELIDANIIKSRLNERVKAYNSTSRKKYELSFSLGMELFSALEGERLNEIIIRADQSMYESKKARKVSRG